MDVNWSDAVLVIPPKKAISIRVDEDVLEFFKREGEGYQRRRGGAAVLQAAEDEAEEARVTCDTVGPSLDSRFAPFDVQALIAAT
ncbi:hypothetical protein ABIB90_008171 [Bradyrhizobium sp. JR4.1]|uniref:BrnA antitoxin family protein n=1 Tax=unclassified Bradyrhizobium TaxID=2631580 RepID=UPI0004B7F90D|nr:BrnA antitoxin family protein [Bradyrhizobium sp. WSM1417]